MPRGSSISANWPAVLDEQERYARFGFRPYYANARHARSAPWTFQAPANAAQDPPLVCSIGDVPPAVLRAYDRGCFPADRGDFASRWTAMPGCRALAVLEDGQVRGYGAIRACRTGHKVAPLFADDAPCAEALLRGLAERVPAGQEVFFDVPEANPAGLPWPPGSARPRCSGRCACIVERSHPFSCPECSGSRAWSWGECGGSKTTARRHSIPRGPTKTGIYRVSSNDSSRAPPRMAEGQRRVVTQKEGWVLGVETQTGGD